MSDQVQVERVIRADAGDLYAMVADVERMGEWSPETDTCEWTKGATGPAVGARFTGTNHKGKKTWSTTCRVAVADPGTAFAFEVTSGPIKVARWAYMFEATGDGCRVTETWADQRSGLVKWASKFVSGVADRADHNRATMEQTLEQLAAAAEPASS